MINDYEHLTLSRFLRIDRVLHTPAEEVDKQVEIISILSDTPIPDILKLPIADYKALARQTAFLGRLCDPDPVGTEAIAVGGFVLVPTTDFTQITTAQYVDFQTFVKDYPASMPQILSCFLTPEGKTYNEGYDIKAVQAAVGELTLPHAVGLVAFFFKRLEASIADTLNSLTLQARTKTQKERIATLKAEAMLSRLTGDGSQA